MCVLVCLCEYIGNVYSVWEHKRVSDPLGLELKAVDSQPKWVLVNKLYPLELHQMLLVAEPFFSPQYKHNLEPDIFINGKFIILYSI